MSKKKDYMVEHLSQLVGKTVTKVVKDGEGYDAFWGLKFDDGTVAFILCDPEGNGPGHLEIQK